MREEYNREPKKRDHDRETAHLKTLQVFNWFLHYGYLNSVQLTANTCNSMAAYAASKLRVVKDKDFPEMLMNCLKGINIVDKGGRNRRENTKNFTEQRLAK